MKCGIGYSNAGANPTLIYRDPTLNVPADFRDGLMNTLGQALNVYNRTQKIIKFGFSTSEDALTWTVLSALARSAKLPALWHLLTGEATSQRQPPRLLLWGVPVDPSDEEAHAIRSQFERISNALGEDPQRRTEPDVMLDAGPAGITIVEVKYTSGNDHKAPSSRFDRYLDASCFSNPDGARSTGLYELIRNWRFGCEMAGNRSLTLVNLVRCQSLTKEQQRIDRLNPNLATGKRRRLILITWERLLDRLEVADTPTMRSFITDRFQ